MCCPGDTHMLRDTGIWVPFWLKKSLEEGPISQKLQKIVKSAIFVVEKPLEMCPADLRKFKKKKKTESAFFEGEKSVS